MFFTTNTIETVASTMSLPDLPSSPLGSGNDPPPLPRKPPGLRRLQAPSSPRGAEAWRADAMRQTGANLSASVESYGAPPPLPPKPAYARAPEVSTGAISIDSSTPPPLPPKPDHVRAEPKPQLPPRPHALLTEARVPTRPLPPLPIPTRPVPLGRDGAGSSRPGDDVDDEGAGIRDIDENVPPERSVVSDALTVPREPPPFHIDSDFLSEHLSDPNDIPDALELPVAPPPCALSHAALPRVFGDPPLKKRDVFSLPPHNEHDVRSAAVEIAHKRSRGRTRLRRAADARATPARCQRIVCRYFEPALPGPEFATVLEEAARESCMTDANEPGVRSPRAMQLLVGFVVKSVLFSAQRGRALFAEAIFRFRSSDQEQCRAAAFTLILNVAAQACFVRGRSHPGVVESMAATLFADLVLGMKETETSNLLWDKAVRCALLLYASEDMVPTQRQRDALLALAANLPAHQHPDLTRRLFEHAEQSVISEVSDGDRRLPGDNVKTPTHYFESMDETLGLYTRTSSLSTRRKLFRAIFRGAVDTAVREDANNPPPSKVEEQALWLRAVLEAHDAGNALVLDFRQGCAPDFVLTLIRQLFFSPLLKSAHDDTDAGITISEDDDASSRWGRTAPAFSADGEEQDTAERKFELSSRRHARSVRTANHLLCKPFALRVLRAIERAANAHAQARAADDDACADEEALARAAVRTAERAALQLRRCTPERATSNSAPSAVAAAEQLRAIHDAAALLVGARGGAHAAAYLTELLLEAILLAPAFAPAGATGASAATSLSSLTTAVGDSVAAEFLAGQLYAIRRMLLDVDAALLLALLSLTEPLWHERYVSQLRQCLVELVGALQEPASLLAPFAEDPDSAVAYRATVVYSTYSESSSSSASQQPQKITRELIRRAQLDDATQVIDDAYTKVLLFKNATNPNMFSV